MASAALNFKVREKLTAHKTHRSQLSSRPLFLLLWVWRLTLTLTMFFMFLWFVNLWMKSIFVVRWLVMIRWSPMEMEMAMSAAPSWSLELWQCLTNSDIWTEYGTSYSAYSYGPSAAYSNSKHFDWLTLLSSVTTFKSKNMNIWRYWVLNIEWVWRSKCKNLNLSLSLGLGLSFMEW